MSEKTRLIPQLADVIYVRDYADTKMLIHSKKHHITLNRYYLFQVLWLSKVFMSTFDNQRMSIGCVGKLSGQSGFLRHYFLKTFRPKHANNFFPGYFWDFFL